MSVASFNSSNLTKHLKMHRVKEHDENALPELHETARERDSCRLKDVQAVSFNTSDVSHRELCIQRFFMFLFQLRLSVKIDNKRMLYGCQSLRGEQYNNDIDYITSTQVSRIQLFKDALVSGRYSISVETQKRRYQRRKKRYCNVFPLKQVVYMKVWKVSVHQATGEWEPTPGSANPVTPSPFLEVRN